MTIERSVDRRFFDIYRRAVIARGHHHGVSKQTMLPLLLLLLLTTSCVVGQEFKFTEPEYELSTVEGQEFNALELVAPRYGRLGVEWAYDSDSSLEFTVQIDDSYRRSHPIDFRASAIVIGDFAFAEIRTDYRMNREVSDLYRLVIRAELRRPGSPTLSATARLRLTVLDSNDGVPYFETKTYTASIPSNAALFSPVVVVTASDADVGRNAIVYYTTLDPYFSVDSRSGQVRVATAALYLDRYTFQVRAYNSAPSKSKGGVANIAQVVVNVTRYNSKRPKLSITKHTLITENVQSGTVVALLRVSDEDSGTVGRVHIDPTAGGGADYFRLMKEDDDYVTSYKVVTRKPIDREQHPNGFNVTITATDMGIPPLSTTVVLYIRVEDVDDERPVFDSPLTIAAARGSSHVVALYNAEVNETAPVGTPLLRVSSLDHDRGVNAEVVYQLLNHLDVFRMNSDTGVISLGAPLDAEVTRRYALNVSAVGRAHLASTPSTPSTRYESYATCIVSVLDRNDNAPAFASHTAYTHLAETAAIGARVFELSATDPDSGDNGLVNYELLNEQVPFKVDRALGFITVDSDLDFERRPSSYNLHIRASDSGTPLQCHSYMTLTITVKDVNDNAPLFERTDCQVNLTRPTSSIRQRHLLRLEAVDFDSIGSKLVYSKVDHNDTHGCLHVNTLTGDIELNCPLHKMDTTDTWYITVQASDGLHTTRNKVVILFVDGPGNTSCKESGVKDKLLKMRESRNQETTLLTIAASNVAHLKVVASNKRPHFKSSLSPPSFSVLENAPLGTVLGEVKAIDEDIGYAGLLQYVIVKGNEYDKFRIDTDTGVLSVYGHIDREQNDRYILGVEVNDLGEPNLTSETIDIEVKVIDVNDNAPLFLFDSDSAYPILESAPIGTKLTKVQASDADTGMNARIRYSLMSGSEPYFKIHSNTGDITLIRPLDREQSSEHILEVRATDAGGLSASQTMKVTVGDVDDNPPRFKQSEYSVHVLEDTPLGAVLLSTGVRDPDTDTDNVIRFSIQGAEANRQFKMNERTGVIRLWAELNYERRSHYDFTVQATGGGEGQTATSRCHIRVVSVDENRNAPLFSEIARQINVSESTSIGTSIATMTAEDYDDTNPRAIPDDYRITFKLLKGDGLGLFQLSRKGNLKTTAILDYETSQGYWLTIVASDSGVHKRHSIQHVYISILDVNDHRPQTLKPVYEVSVPEDVLASHRVVRIEAIDLDSKANRLTFSIVKGALGYFTIDSRTGIIKTKASLDREKINIFYIQVKVSDNDVTTPLTSTCLVIITVLDINETPEFSLYINEADVSVLESGDDYNAASYIPVHRTIALDADLLENCTLTYTIETENWNSSFVIDATSGLISTNVKLIKSATFSLKVTATDSSYRMEDRFRVEHSFVLKVVPRPTKSKQLSFKEDKMYVQLNLEGGINEFIIDSSELIEQHANSLWYNITDGNPDNTFYIYPNNGMVLLVKRLTGAPLFYLLTITATDGLTTTSYKLRVNISKGLAPRPIFEQPQYLISVDETTAGAGVGVELLRVRVKPLINLSTVYYYIYETEDPSSRNRFSVKLRKGIISVIGGLDREVQSIHKLTIQAVSKDRYDLTRVVIHVLDKNDNSPEFTRKKYSLTIPSETSIGTTILTVIATDSDIGSNGEITYSIINGNSNEYFVIDSKLGEISLAKNLSMKTVDENVVYKLVVKAIDNGENKRFHSTCRVLVTVLRSVYVMPKFERPVYMAEIDEDVKIGSLVVMVSASAHAPITYKLQVNSTVNNDLDLFSVNPFSGAVTTTDLLDYETSTVHYLTVLAIGTKGDKVTCSIVVHIRDVNDLRPKFIEWPRYVGVVSESSLENDVIVRMNDSGRPLVIQAVDLDSFSNLKYTIPDAEMADLFHIDEHTGALRLNSQLDRELRPQYRFSVTCTDGRYTASPQAEVTIVVRDVNDSPPQFADNQINLKVSIPTSVGQFIWKGDLTDQDLNTNGKYTIQPHASPIKVKNCFTVNPSTGVLRLSCAKPFVAGHSQFRFGLVFSDGERRDIVSLIVTSHQHYPPMRFRSVKSLYYVKENITSVQTVAMLDLDDSNVPVGSQVHYTIENDHHTTTEYRFNIGSTSGILKTSGAVFDREVREKYTVLVAARIKGRVVHQTIIRVKVTDTNDNAPEFIEQPFHWVVKDHDKVGTIINTIRAVDRDIGENRMILYSIVRGNRRSTFKIDAKTGDLSLNRVLKTKEKDFLLSILARDQGFPVLKSRIKMKIIVASNATPVFQHREYSIDVKEDIDTYIGLISLRAVTFRELQVVYSIVEGNRDNQFSIDFKSESDESICTVIALSPLDYERTKQYKLLIRAIDMESGLYSEVHLNINVIDVNDNPPLFPSSVYYINVNEQLNQISKDGELLTTLTTKDRDSSPVVSYSMLVDDSRFNLDPDSGNLYLVKRLDYEKTPRIELTVVASDHTEGGSAGGGGGLSLNSTASIIITVINVNDNAPTFDTNNYEFTFSSRLPCSTFIGRVTANDLDGDSMTFKLASGDPSDHFRLDKNTGILTTSPRCGDDSTAYKTSYLLNISVTDGVHMTFAKVRVIVRPSPLDLSALTFARYRFDVNVGEDAAKGFKVRGIYRARYTNHMDNAMSVTSNITYRLISQRVSPLFTVDYNTGDVYCEGSLDREQLHTHVLPIIATDHAGNIAFMKVYVNVTDVNDNEPYFKVKAYRTNVRVDANIGDFVLAVKAYDADVGINGSITYSIVDNDDGLFSIDKDHGTIRVSKSLSDYLVKGNKLVQLFVRANDRGERSKSATISIEIMLMQPTTKVPEFLHSKDSDIFVKDSLAIGATVISLVQPIWPTKLRYSLANRNTPFAINITSGSIVVQQNIENFSANKYVLYVLASTLDIPYVVGKVKVKIRIKRTKNKSPVFDSDVYEFPISEATKIGTEIAEVRATDRQTVKYRLQEENQYFSVHLSTGMITSKALLDKEIIGSHTFTVIARERQGLESSTTVTISLVDVNDIAPVFKHSHYTAYAYEDASMGTVLSNIVASDSDSDSVIRYSVISGDKGGLFSMSDNGDLVIRRADSLDYETRSEYNSVQIAAMDDVHVTMATVTVNIRNVNDNTPVCARVYYKLSVLESINVDSEIVSVKATDADHDNLTYSIEGDYKYFSINPLTGVVRNKHKLDREKIPQHNFKVVATDPGGHACETKVTVNLIDVNDNPPTFMEAIKVGRDQVVVFENANKETVLARFMATDRDLGKNKKIKYSLVNHRRQFSIDPNTAILKLKGALDRETKPIYNITVIATDQGSPAMMTTAYIWVRVLDINDNPPIFTQSRYHATVSESTPSGHTLEVAILATSKDTGVNAQIVYAIVSGNDRGHFEIDSGNGRITIVKVLDFETTKKLSLVIKARDLGDPPLWVTAILEVKVTDYNDNAPMFMKPNFHLRLSEDARIGSTFRSYKAEDLDRGENAMIYYSILRGDQDNQFSIDKNTGELSVVKELDREKISEYTLILQATDNGLPSLMGTAELVIDIEDVNDCAPVFTNSVLPSYPVPTDRSIGYVVTKLQVTDADGINNGGPFTYALVPSAYSVNSNHFRVDSSGQLKVAHSLDRDLQSSYTLNISAQDSGNPRPLKGYMELRISIVGASVHPPVIQALTITVLVPPGQRRILGGVHIANIRATDADQYDTVTFSLVESYLFDLDKVTGELTVGQQLTVGTFKVNVSATDTKFTSYEIITVKVESGGSPQALSSAVVVRLRVDELTDALVLHVRDTYIDAVSQALQVKRAFVSIISIQPAAKSNGGSRRKRDTRDELDLLLVLRTSRSGNYMSAKHLKQNLMVNMHDINARLSSQDIIMVDYKQRVCLADTCSSHGKCKPRIAFTDTETSYSNGTHSFVTINHKSYAVCRCERGFTGDTCNIIGNDVCSRHPCEGDQICHAEKNSYSCVCPQAGCQVQNRNTLTFYGNSFTSWMSSVAMRYSLQIHMQLKTSQSHSRATLFYIDGSSTIQNFYCLEILEQGNVQFRYNLGMGEVTVKVNTRINDGKWHSIDLKRTSKKIILDIDDGASYKKVSVQSTDKGLQIDSRVFYIGANVTDNGDEAIAHGFVGCIKDFKVDGRPLTMSQSSRKHFATYITNRNIEFGCEPLSTINTVDASCLVMRCENGGRCSYDQHTSTSLCLCPVGFTGPRCQRSCPRGLTGDSCNLDLDECAVTSCQNDALCRNTYASFHCECTRPGTHGRLCEQVSATAASISNDHRLIIIIVIVAMLIVLIVAAIFIIIMRCRWQRKNRSQHQDADDDRCYQDMKNRSRHNKTVTMEESQHNFMQSRPPPVPNRPISYTPSSICGSVGTVNAAPEVIPLLMRNGTANDDQLGNDIQNMKIPEYMESVWGTKDGKDGGPGGAERHSPGPTPPPRYHDIIHSGAGFNNDRTAEYGEKRSLLAPNACLHPDDEHNVVLTSFRPDYHWDQYDLKNTKLSPTTSRPDDIDTEADSNIELYDVSGVDMFDLSGGGAAPPPVNHDPHSANNDDAPVIAYIDDADCNNSDVDLDLLDDAESYAGVGTYKRLIKEHQNIQYEITDEDDDDDRITDVPLTEYTSTMSYLPDFPDPCTPLATRAMATATIERPNHHHRRGHHDDDDDDITVDVLPLLSSNALTIATADIDALCETTTDNDEDVIKTFI